jgi:hypothetical protein
MPLFDNAGWVRGQTVNVILKFFLKTLPPNRMRSLEVSSTWFQLCEKAIPACSKLVTLFPCNSERRHWSLAVLLKAVSNDVRFIKYHLFHEISTSVSVSMEVLAAKSYISIVQEVLTMKKH